MANKVYVTDTVTGTVVATAVTGSGAPVLATSPTIATPRVEYIHCPTNGFPGLQLTDVASADNWLQISPTASGSDLSLNVANTAGANCGLNLSTVGTGTVKIGGVVALSQTNTVSGITNKTFVAPVLGSATATAIDVPTVTGGAGAMTITGGAGNMTITSGTGASRTMILRTTTSGSAATTALTLGADQSATFAGIGIFPNGTFSAPSIVFTGSSTSGFYQITTGVLGVAVSAGSTVMAWASNEVRVTAGVNIGWATPNSHSANDTNMSRLAAGVLGVPGFAGTPQALSGHGAVAATNLTSLTTTYANDGTADTTTTLAAGTSGQIKILSFITDGGFNAVVTVTNAFWGGAGTLTFDDAGDNAILIYLNSKWQLLVNNGATTA